MENKRLIYTSPVKSLSNQKYAELKEKYGEQSVGLATGDNKVKGLSVCLAGCMVVFFLSISIYF